MDIAIPDIPGFNTEEGLAYCADDPEFYIDMLGEYSSEAFGSADELNRAYAACDWEAYRIRVHSVKSSSKLIGAGRLAESAFELETAAKNSDAERVKQLHEPFISDYLKLSELICTKIK